MDDSITISCKIKDSIVAVIEDEHKAPKGITYAMHCIQNQIDVKKPNNIIIKILYNIPINHFSPIELNLRLLFCQTT